MSMYYVYIKVKPFVREWLYHHFGNPVVFPARSAENATIRRFLTRLPDGETPDTGSDGNVRVAIPDSKQKPVVTYNYLTPYGKEAVVEAIEDTFRRQMWNDLNDLRDTGCSLLTAVKAWCEQNGISTQYDYTIKMRYQRMREAYLAKGIDLRFHRRKR